jgi:hypothetical protein
VVKLVVAVRRSYRKNVRPPQCWHRIGDNQTFGCKV